ncbi:hypothetical protein AGMMS49546_38880 [Spirochaetia bacterium]|nr:hypothetical protein AGMMS49546_38880 [Spirochaetia bacterium]
MSKLTDLFKKAQKDPALLADMEAIHDVDSIVTAMITVAADHGISMDRSDFLYNYGELGENELASVVGGVANSSLAKLWLDLYNSQVSTNSGELEKQG